MIILALVIGFVKQAPPLGMEECSHLDAHLDAHFFYVKRNINHYVPRLKMGR